MPFLYEVLLAAWKLIEMNVTKRGRPNNVRISVVAPELRKYYFYSDCRQSHESLQMYTAKHRLFLPKGWTSVVKACTSMVHGY